MLRFILRHLHIMTMLGLLSACAVAESVDKGLYSLTEAVSETDAVTGRRALSLADRRGQIKTGNAQMQQVVDSYKKKKKPVDAAVSKAMYARLQRVVNNIVAVSHYSNEKWRAFLLPDDSFNAFTTGGNTIAVFKGLMDQSDDDELAAVIGHEIAHAVANHVHERQGVQMASVLAGSKAAGTKSFATAFTHEMEEEADKVGILYAAMAGYDPYAASRLWQKRYKDTGNYGGYLHSHPMHSERASNTKKIADQVKAYYKKGKRNPQHKAILQGNNLWRKQTAQHEVGKGGGLASLLEVAATTLVQKQTAQAEAARQTERAAAIQTLQKQFTLQAIRQPAKGRIEAKFGYQGPYTITQPAFAIYLNKKRHIARYTSSVKNGQSIVVTAPTDLTLTTTMAKGTKWLLDDVKAVKK